MLIIVNSCEQFLVARQLCTKIGVEQPRNLMDMWSQPASATGNTGAFSEPLDEIDQGWSRYHLVSHWKILKILIPSRNTWKVLKSYISFQLSPQLTQHPGAEMPPPPFRGSAPDVEASLASARFQQWTRELFDPGTITRLATSDAQELFGTANPGEEKSEAWCRVAQKDARQLFLFWCCHCTFWYSAIRSFYDTEWYLDIWESSWPQKRRKKNAKPRWLQQL